MERRQIALGAALAVMTLSAAPAHAQVPSVDPAVLPTTSDCRVTTLDSDSARITATVDPNGQATTYRVEYGLLGILNLISPTLSAGSSPDPTIVNTQLDRLVPGAGYSCRIVALNSAGETVGGTSLFTAGSDGSDGSSGSNGSGGTGATPMVNPATGKIVAAGTPGAVKCTLAGTAGKDRLKGTKRADVICGLGGADRIRGLAGNDTLLGGTGNDRLKGAGGNDRVFGNKGKDRLLGGKGKDRLSGSQGADYLFGWKGRDRMSGGAGGDRFVANRDHRGGDRVNGGKGRDRADANHGDRVRAVERRRRLS
jgi:Ca2+-binding RTX toxin-like protein